MAVTDEPSNSDIRRSEQTLTPAKVLCELSLVFEGSVGAVLFFLDHDISASEALLAPQGCLVPPPSRFRICGCLCFVHGPHIPHFLSFHQHTKVVIEDLLLHDMAWRRIIGVSLRLCKQHTLRSSSVVSSTLSYGRHGFFTSVWDRCRNAPLGLMRCLRFACVSPSPSHETHG